MPHTVCLLCLQAAMCLITVRDVIMAHGRQRMISTSLEDTALSVGRAGLEGIASVSVLSILEGVFLYNQQIVFSFLRLNWCFFFRVWRSHTEASRSCDPGELSNQCGM